MVSKGLNQSGSVNGFAHVGYSTGHLENTVEFYCGILGIENSRVQLSDQPYLSEVTGYKDCSLKIGFVRPEGDTLPFEIIEYLNPKGGKINTDFNTIGSAHISWETDNIQILYKKLKDKGVDLLSEPMELEYGYWKNAKGVFFRDPFGLLNQLIQIDSDMKGMGRLLRMHHVCYLVNNLDCAVDFLCNSLGLELIGSMNNDSAFVIKSGKLKKSSFKSVYVKIPDLDFIFELWCFDEVKTPSVTITSNLVGNVHLCFKVKDMDYSYNVLTQSGLKFVGPPAEVTAGVNKGAYAIYMNGIESIICELFQGPQTKI